MAGLSWLPELPDIRARLRALAAANPDDAGSLRAELLALSRSRLDFVQTNGLDGAGRKLAAQNPEILAFPQRGARLAILGSCTCAHLHAGLRVAGWRRELGIEVYEADFGQYWQELTDTTSALHGFAPNAVLFALDAHHLAAGIDTAMAEADVQAALDEVLGRIRGCWQLAREAFGALVIHQVPLNVHAPLLGSNEHRLPGSRTAFIGRLCAALRPAADEAGVDLVALDHRASADGLAAWHDVGLWHRAKQEISPAAGTLYGDLVVRLIAARQGRSAKCLVLDLDNTLWGGVIGDDGLGGIVLGQGSALGEAFVAFQHYARELSRRGVILAVCSKNDEANALEPFEKHPEMVLRRGDIASFVANWNDKANNLRVIAEELNIGLDSLVFVDDNPFERALVRQELPMVAVPEIGDDPTCYTAILADAGYFEAAAITQEDRERSSQYQGNRLRAALQSSATDLPSYLHGLEMELIWRRFDTIGLARIVQLINKTNQFNLTTRRMTEDGVRAIIADPRAFGLQLRLVDRFGDNGIIAIVIGRMQDADDLVIDTWLMSCRVLGRQVEPTTLNLVAEQARRLGAKRLVGDYIPTKKNGMVAEHYPRLGFTVVHEHADGGSRAVLELTDFVAAETFIAVREG